MATTWGADSAVEAVAPGDEGHPNRWASSDEEPSLIFRYPNRGAAVAGLSLELSSARRHSTSPRRHITRKTA